MDQFHPARVARGVLGDEEAHHVRVAAVVDDDVQPVREALRKHRF